MPFTASPAETVIFYPPGESTAATRLLPAIDGPAAVEADPALPQHHLHLVAGTGLTATTAASPTVPAASGTPPMCHTITRTVRAGLLGQERVAAGNTVHAGWPDLSQTCCARLVEPVEQPPDSLASASPDRDVGHGGSTVGSAAADRVGWRSAKRSVAKIAI